MTIEEIRESAEGNAELLDGLVSFVIETDKGKEVLTNHAKAHFDENVGKRIGEIHTRYDDDIEGILGVKKKPEQKSYEFVKELATELKTLKEKGGSGSEADKKRIKELEEQVKSGSGNEHWHKTFEEAKKTWTTEKEELIQSKSQLETQILDNTIGYEISKGVSSLKFNPSIPKDARDVLVNNAINQIKSKAKMVEGKLVLYKDGADGLTPLLNSKFEPMSPEEALKTSLATMLEVGNKSKGGQGGKSSDFGKVAETGSGDDKSKFLTMDMAKISTREQFAYEYESSAISAGLQRGSKEWYAIEQTTMKKYGITELPRS